MSCAYVMERKTKQYVHNVLKANFLNYIDYLDPKLM